MRLSIVKLTIKYFNPFYYNFQDIIWLFISWLSTFILFSEIKIQAHTQKIFKLF